MTSNRFKIVGALLVLVLAVSFSVGAVSATPTFIYDGTAPIVSGSFLPSSTPVSWSNPQPYVNATTTTDKNALEGAAILGGFTYNVTIDNAGDWGIDDINGIVMNPETYALWYPYINDDCVYYLSGTTLAVGDVLTLCYTEAPGVDLDTTIADSEYVVKATVGYVNGPLTIYNGSVTLASGTFDITLSNEAGTQTYTFNDVSYSTALGALITGSNNQANYQYTLGADSWGTPYVWLVTLNGIKRDWDTTGNGWVMVVSNTTSTIAPSDSIEKISLQSGDTFTIYMSPSSSGGTLPTGVTVETVSDQYGTDYYIGAATHKFTLTVN